MLLRNEGNAEATFALSTGKQGAPLTYALTQTQVRVEAGQVAVIPLQVSASQRLIGEPIPYTVNVRAEAPDHEQQASAEFVHLAAVRTLLLAAVLGTLLLAVLLGSLWNTARNRRAAAIDETPCQPLGHLAYIGGVSRVATQAGNAQHRE